MFGLFLSKKKCVEIARMYPSSSSPTPRLATEFICSSKKENTFLAEIDLQALRIAPRSIGIHTGSGVYKKAMNLSGFHGVDNVMELFEAMKTQGNCECV